MRKSALCWFGLVVVALTALGLIILCSASQPNSMRLNHGAAFAFFLKQILYVVIGVAVAAVVACIDYHVWKDRKIITWLFYGIVFVLLLVVLKWFGGRAVNGSYRWIRLGPVNLQPSELAKLAIVIVTAVWVDSISWKIDRFLLGAGVPFLLIGAYAGPILMETDLGATMVMGAAGGLVMFVAGVKLIHLLVPFVLGGAGFLGVMFTDSNRMRRLAAWLPASVCDLLGVTPAVETNKISEMNAAAYQSYNSLVAIKRGGLAGVGLGQSMQKQLYLPEAHTDFIFAVGAEELGIGFSVGVILLFFAFFALTVYIANRATDRLGRYLALGMGFIVFFQAMFNLGVVCEAVPTKGMALPFFSYGGTNMLSAFFAVGVILSVGIHSYRDRKRVIRHNVLL